MSSVRLEPLEEPFERLWFIGIEEPFTYSIQLSYNIATFIEP
jgi:hypothetical protein